MKKRLGFTLLEMVFVIVILGIISKYIVEFLAKSYENFVLQEVQTRLSQTSASAVEFIAKQLEYRIRASVIVRDTTTGNYLSLEGQSNLNGYDVLEWVGYDIDSFRGLSGPLWSGILDKQYSKSSGSFPSDVLTPGTNTSSVSGYINKLSDNNATINNAAFYALGSDSNVSDFGWDGNITTQRLALHPIKASLAGSNRFDSSNAEDFKYFNSVVSDPRYKLTWSAHAIVYDPVNNQLWYHYDYRPWFGEKYNDPNTKKILLMDHVSTFKKSQSFNVIKIIVCTKDELTGDNYSVCKEKTII